MGGAEIVGIGAVATGAFALVWKMWSDHSALSKSVTVALVDNTKSNIELREAIRAQSVIINSNTDAVSAAVKEFKEGRDEFSQTLLKVLQK